MARHIVQRLLQMAPLLFVISVLAFMLMHLAPGDPTVFFLDPAKAGVMSPEEGARLRAQFKKITVGMSPAQVRDLMGTEPDVSRGNVWQFKLSRASDRWGERDWTLAVRFENGTVSETWAFRADYVPKVIPGPTTR